MCAYSEIKDPHLLVGYLFEHYICSCIVYCSVPLSCSRVEGFFEAPMYWTMRCMTIILHNISKVPQRMCFFAKSKYHGLRKMKGIMFPQYITIYTYCTKLQNCLLLCIPLFIICTIASAWLSLHSFGCVIRIWGIFWYNAQHSTIYMFAFHML